MNPEEVRTSEVQTETILWNEEPSIAPALNPCAVLVAPNMRAIVSPVLMSSLPASSVEPSSLLLPGLRLLLGALRISAAVLLIPAAVLLVPASFLLLRNALLDVFRSTALLGRLNLL